MSSNAADAFVIRALFQSIYAGNFCEVATSALFIYNTFVTFDREVKYFWTAKWTGASLLYFANKWISMAVYVLGMAALASLPSDKFLPWAVIVVSRVPLIVAETLLIYITWTRLDGRNVFGALGGISQSKRLSLSDILFNNGIIYFVVLFILNLLHLVLSATATVSGNGFQSFVTVFTGPITAILVSHFLLELQEASQVVIRVDHDDPLHSWRDPSSTPGFVASLGAYLDPDLLAPRDEDSE
ncbi:hypothetical protein L226DRAFT_614175 [Lentinus tigrinus ALCF2SS1-7]|uniref:DUF6533 domain-containing protein n=1 Tax=Lentinus tigrinus ALCF2SS1-6 TaxID=1328759 RepID=A0A5C2S758_9APHY|nr:hypothetical protein L227DRAFT_654431 [Lentinus tigrinus ALCF2SS1-6]RPD73259.1 hypothetical protein L226DRAFT_614175 [Lentinus tigrinus ALCF2SS1-7]